jgi:polyhydroxyalkanoate synthesis regulator phasin
MLPTISVAIKDDTLAEREMILRMVAEGKITAEEGHQLLEALE